MSCYLTGKPSNNSENPAVGDPIPKGKYYRIYVYIHIRIYIHISMHVQYMIFSRRKVYMRLGLEQIASPSDESAHSNLAQAMAVEFVDLPI